MLLIIATRFLELPNLPMLIKQKSPSLSEAWLSGQVTNNVLNKGKSAIPPLLNGTEVLSFASDKAQLFAENFSKNSNLDNSGISLPVLTSRTNLKLCNISVASKMFKKVIMKLHLSKASQWWF